MVPTPCQNNAEQHAVCVTPLLAYNPLTNSLSNFLYKTRVSVMLYNRKKQTHLIIATIKIHYKVLDFTLFGTIFSFV